MHKCEIYITYAPPGNILYAGVSRNDAIASLGKKGGSVNVWQGSKWVETLKLEPVKWELKSTGGH